MGGVISRLYVQSPDYQHEVRRIVTSNTPHAGSQMANLLLDRTFDPQGLLCSAISQAMSSPSLPNRGCLNGAVEDMQVTSPATVIDLNQGTHPPEIGVHAIATFFDLAGATDLSSIPVTKETVGPLIIAQVLRGCGLSLIDTIFGFDDSDNSMPRSAAMSSAFTRFTPSLRRYSSSPAVNAAVSSRVFFAASSPLYVSVARRIEPCEI